MSSPMHGYPWPSLATFPYRSSAPAGLLGYILCPHIAAVYKFGLVILLLFGHMRGVHRRYVTYELVLASPAVSCVSGWSDLYSSRDGRQVAVQLASRGVLSPGLVQYCSQYSCVVAVMFLAVLLGAASRIYSEQHATRLCIFLYKVYSLSVSFLVQSCNFATQLLHEQLPLLFKPRDLIPIW